MKHIATETDLKAIKKGDVLKLDNGFFYELVEVLSIKNLQNVLVLVLDVEQDHWYFDEELDSHKGSCVNCDLLSIVERRVTDVYLYTEIEVLLLF